MAFVGACIVSFGAAASVHAASTVSGKLTTPTGTAVSYASVTLRDNSYSVYNWTSTASDGTFSFNNVPSCSCVLQVWANNAEYADPDDRSVNVTGDAVDLGTITLAAHNVIGKLTAPDGTTAATSISVAFQSADYTIYRWDTTDSSGNFSFRVPSAGTYTLKINSDFTNGSTTYYAPSDSSITVTDPSATLNLGTVFMKNPNVTGTAMDGTAISGASFTAHTSNWTVSRWVSSNTSGNFGFYLPAGTYILETYLPWATYGSGRNPDPQTFTVTEGQATSLGVIGPQTVNFTLTLTKSNGSTPVSNASVNVHTANWGISKYGTTDTSGNVSLAITTATTYTVEIWLGYDTSFDESRPDNFTFTYTSGNAHYDVKTQGPAMRGKVTKADGTTAVQGASVYLYSSNYMNSKWASTDASGNFTLDTVPTGTYTLEVTPPWDATDLIAPDKITVSLTSGQTNEVYRTTPIALAAASKTVTVTVQRENGNAVTDASINAWRQDGSGYRWGSVNASGQYTMTIGKGKWQISTWPNWTGSSPDWTYSKTPATVEFTQANSVSESATVTLVVESYTATITGTVQNPDGTVPSSYSSVSIWSQSGKGNWAQLDSNGAFSLKVAPDTYTVNIYSSSPVYAAPELAPVTVKDGETKALGVIKLVTMSAKIKGTVSDSNNKALSGQSVYAWRKNASGWASGTTDSNGNYSLSVSPGTWMVNAYPSWCGYGDCANTVQYSASYDPIEAIVNENETKENVNFIFAIKDATINGTVQDENGNRIDAAYGWVEARASDSTQSWSNTGSNAQEGKFSIAVVGGKTYDLGMWTSWGADYTMKSAEPITVTSGQTVENAVIKMVKKDAKLTGSLKDADGNVLTDVTGSVYANCGPSSYEWSAFSSGTYTLNLSPGTCAVDYWVDYRLKDYYKKPLPDSGKVTVVSGETKTLDITLQKLDAVITGKVYDSNGNPFSAYVSADTELGGKKKSSSIYDMYGGKFELSTTSDSDGNFTLKVPSGSYYISASVATGLGYINPKVQEVTVSATSPASLSFTFLKPDATITGTVTIGTATASVRSFSQFRAASGQASPAFVSAWSDSGGMVSYSTNDGSYTLNVSGGDTWHVTASYTDTANNKIYKSTEYLVVPEKDGTVAQSISMELQDITLPSPKTITSSTDVTTTMTMDDGTTLTIPANSIPVDNNTPVGVTISATPTADLLETSEATLAEGFGLDLEITYNGGAKSGQDVNSLTQNAVLSIAYDGDALAKDGIEESQLTASTWNDASGSWDQPDSIIVDSANNRVSMTTDHFSKYAIVTSTSAASAPSITLTAPSDTTIVKKNRVKLVGTVNDAKAALSYSLNGGASKTITVGSDGAFSTTVTSLKAGKNTLTLSASNNAGTSTPVTRTVTFTRASRAGDADRIVVTPMGQKSPNILILSASGKVLKKFKPFGSTALDLRTLVTDLNSDGTDEIVVYRSAGAPIVKIYSTDGKLLGTFLMQAKSFRGMLTIIAADMDGDGTKELISAPLSDSSQIRIYDMNGKFRKAFIPMTNAVKSFSVTSGDLDGDQTAELLVLDRQNGSPQLRVFNGSGKLVSAFYLFSKKMRGAYSLVTADTNADGKDEIIAATGKTLIPEVRIFNNKGKLQKKFTPVAKNFRGGVNISAGDVTGDGKDDIVVSAASKGTSSIRVFDAADGKLKATFNAYGAKLRGGFSTITSDLTEDGVAEIIVVPDTGLKQALRIFTSKAKLSAAAQPFGKKYKGGYFVSVNN